MQLKRLLLVVVLSLPAMAQISFVDKCTGTTSCASVPAHQAGDLFIAFEGVNATATAPTLATGWTNVGTSSINGTSTADSAVRVSCKVAVDSSTTVTGFTSATSLAVHIYRGTVSATTANCAANILGTPVFTASAINTTTTSEVFASVTNASTQSWDVAFGYAPAATAGITTPPTGMTNRSAADVIMGGHDTNAVAGTTSFTGSTKTLTTNSRIITVVLEVKAPTADAPTITAASGSFTVNNNDTSFTITNGGSAVSSPTFCYTTDGSTPAATTPGTCSAGSTYSGSVNVTATATVVKVLATKAGANNSSVTTQTFTLTVATPVASPAGSSFVTSTTVGLTSSTTSAVIHYTTNGATPDCSSTTYSVPLTFTVTTTLKSIGCKASYVNSAVQSDVYTSSTPTTRTVKQAGGGTCTVIQTCVNLMGAGDTTTVFAGTYNENVTLPAGAAGSYVTLQVNGTDVVNVLDFTMASHTKVIGFNITNPSSPASAPCIGFAASSTDIVIQGNTMYACGSNGMIEPVTAPYPSYVQVLNNTLSYSCSTSAAPDICLGILARGDHWLAEGNDISKVIAAFTRLGSFGTIRNNTYHDSNNLTECIVSGSGGHGSNCHFDFIELEPGSATQFNVVEGNSIYNILGDANAKAGILAQGDICAGACHDLIDRFNQYVHIAGAITTNDNNGSTVVNPGFYNVKRYNNTHADIDRINLTGGVTGFFINNSTGGLEINNLYYYVGSSTSLAPYSCNSRLAGADTCSTFTNRNNLAFCTGTCTLYGQVYEQGTFLTTAGANNVVSNPLFSSYSPSGLGSLYLQAGSPALAVGSYLTTASGAGSGSTSLTVVSASPFQAGDSTLGVAADYIAVGTVSNTSQICGVNYSTNVITLCSALTWSDGASVWLKKLSDGTDVLTGAAPNIGAFGQIVAPVASYSPVSASTIAYGNQTSTTTSSPQSVTLTNTGNSTLTISSVALTTGTVFAISSNNCSTLAASASCIVSVTFTPALGQAYSDTLTITTDGGTGTFPLTGTGTGPPATSAAITVNGRSAVHVCLGQSALLSWTGEGDGTLACTMNGVSKSAIDTLSVSPTSSTTYTFSCTSGTGSAQASVTVNESRCGGPF